MSLGKLFGMDQTGTVGERTCLLPLIGYATAAALAIALAAKAVTEVA